MNDINFLFQVEESWEEIWKEMPEFVQDDKSPYQKLIVNFETKEDLEQFQDLLNIKITKKTKYIWFPIQKDKEKPKNFVYLSNES